MAYTIQYDLERKVIRVNYQGEVSLRERVAAVEEVCRDYPDSDPMCILVDVREMVSRLSVHEQQRFGIFLASHPGLSHARVAVLHQPQYNPNVVVDAIAFNQGYVLAEFNQTEAAYDWLAASA